MINAIIKILLGYLLARVIPQWIKYGNKKTRAYLQLICNVVGIILVILGVVSLIKSLV